MSIDGTDTDRLASQLHELVDGIAPDTAAGMQRAQHTIRRRARNRRALVGAAVVVVVAAGAGAFVGVRDHDESARPAVTTSQPSIPRTTTSVLTTTTATTSSTTPRPVFVNGSPYAVPPIDQLPLAHASYSVPFAWGRGDGQVSFAVKGGEGASGGPAAFTAGANGDVVLLDHSNARILVHPASGAPTTRTVAMPSPAVTAAVFDGHDRLIAAFYNDLVVYSATDGKTLGGFPGAGPSGGEITRLVAVGATVYSVAEDGTLHAELHDAGSGYTRATNGPLETGAVTITYHQPPSTLDVRVTGGPTYTFTGTDAGSTADVPAARSLPDGSLVLVLGQVQHGITDPDQARPYLVVRIDPEGNAHYARIDASMGYLVGGPEFVIDPSGVAVMSSTTTAGVTVSYFGFNNLF